MQCATDFIKVITDRLFEPYYPGIENCRNEHDDYNDADTKCKSSIGILAPKKEGHNTNMNKQQYW